MGGGRGRGTVSLEGRRWVSYSGRCGGEIMKGWVGEGILMEMEGKEGGGDSRGRRWRLGGYHGQEMGISAHYEQDMGSRGIL